MKQIRQPPTAKLPRLSESRAGTFQSKRRCGKHPRLLWISAVKSKRLYVKKAIDARIVFAEINIPELPDSDQQVESLRKILEDIRKRESETLNSTEPLPSTYVVVTNHPFLYFPDKSVKPWAVAEGFRLPDFGWRAKFGSLREALAAREKHQEMFALRKSWEQNYEIPTTFDGEIPEFAFDNRTAALVSRPRLQYSK